MTEITISAILTIIIGIKVLKLQSQLQIQFTIKITVTITNTIYNYNFSSFTRPGGLRQHGQQLLPGHVRPPDDALPRFPQRTGVTVQDIFYKFVNIEYIFTNL
jgi:hypothetical protein